MLCCTLLVSMLLLEMNISLKLHFFTIILLNSTNIRFKEIRTLVFHVCSFIVDCKCALVSRFLFFLLFNCVILKFWQFFSQLSSKTSWFYNLKTRKFKFLSFLLLRKRQNMSPRKTLLTTMLLQCWGCVILCLLTD